VSKVTDRILEEADVKWPVLMDPDKPFAIVINISPEIAGDWMARNNMNRPLAEVTVKKYASLILNNRWQLNGDTIKFSKKGNLIDGQHRLTGIIVSQSTVPCLVVFNIDEDAFITLDRPKKRSIANVLALKGEKNVGSYAAVLSWYWKYSTGRSRLSGPEGWPEPDDILKVLAEHPGLRDSLNAVTASRFRVLSGTTALAVTHYVLGDIDEPARDEFFNLLAVPAELDEFHPIWKLRERLVQDRISKNKLSQHERIAIIFKAWNAWRAGRDVRVLGWRSSGAGSEAFPEPS